jgi:hypothetical protein
MYMYIWIQCGCRLLHPRCLFIVFSDFSGYVASRWGAGKRGRVCHPHGMSQKTSDLGQETKKWLGMWISNQLPAFWTPDTSYFNNMLQCGTPQKKTSRPHPQYCNRWLVPSQMDPGLAGLPVRLCSPSAGLSKPVEAAEFSNVCYMYIYITHTYIIQQ